METSISSFGTWIMLVQVGHLVLFFGRNFGC